MAQINMSYIAEKAGVSRQSVSSIFNGGRAKRVSEETREKVLKIAEELNYKPNYFAQALKTGRTNMIGVCTTGGDMGYFHQPYAGKVYRGIGKFFNECDYRLIFNNSYERFDLRQYRSLLEPRIVDGLIFLISSRNYEEFINHELEQIKKIGIPFVIISSFRDDLDCPHVGLDCEKAGQLATEHLINHGHRSIGCIKYHPYRRHCEDLFNGYKKALDNHGLKLDDELVLSAPGSALNTAYRLADKLLDQERPLPDAMFTVNEDLGYGLVTRLREAGKRVPEDIAVISFSDTHDYARTITAMTTIHQPATEKGYKASELLMKLLEKPEITNIKEEVNIILEPELAIGTSCGCNEPTLTLETR